MENSSIKNIFLNKTVLITGGAGFIGSNLAKAIYKFAKKVVIFDLFGSQNTLGHFKNLTNITNKTGGGGIFVRF